MTQSIILSRFRFTRWFLAFSMLVMGCCGIVYEYTLGLMGNNLMGSSHQQIFVIIGIMMFAMGMGALAQRALTQHLLDWFLRLELLLSVLGGFAALFTYIAFVYLVNYELILYTLAFSIGMLIGLEIPLLIRINSAYSNSLRSNLGDILTMDYVGSLLGALLFTYVLLTQVSLTNIALIMGLCNAMVAAIGLWFFFPLIHRPLPLALSIAVVLGLLIWALFHSNTWVSELQQRTFEDPIVHSSTSKYQHTVITQGQGEKGRERVRLYINGNLQFDARDEQIYHEQLVHVPMSLASKKTHILILGGGDGLALREVLKYPTVKHVTLVDIDPDMVRLAIDNPLLSQYNQNAFADARVQTHIIPRTSIGKRRLIQRPTHLQDGLLNTQIYPLAEVDVYTLDADNFLRADTAQYDVAILDFPDPRSVELSKLYSVDFYQALRQRLSPEGIISVQSTSPYRAKHVFLCIQETLRAAGFNALPYHDHLPSFGDWGWHLAWADTRSHQQVRTAIQAVTEFKIATRYLTPAVMQAAFVFGKNILNMPETVQANSKMLPVIMGYYMQGFE